jgi:hypothetical protein
MPARASPAPSAAGRLGSQIEMLAQSHDCKLRGNLLDVTEISAGDAAKITTLRLPIFVITIIVLLTIGGGASLAASYNDEGTLALAALVGANSPALTQQQKTWLALALDGKIASVPPKSGHITVTADHVTCVGFAGDPTNHSCDLTFGKNPKVTITGRSAHELYATIGEAGVPVGPAAGMRYESIQNLSCTIDFDALRQIQGGARCNLTCGPESQQQPGQPCPPD